MTDESTTIPQLIDIWQESLEAVASLGESVDEEQWHAPTPCPGWDVADVVAHLIDIEQVLAALPRPDHEPDWAALPHVDRELSRFTEVGVDVRRGRPRADVLEELRASIMQRRAQLDATPGDAEVTGPLGRPTSMERLLRIRIFDTWAHEQDIRSAISADGGWATRPASVSMQQMTSALPHVWAHSVGAPEGTTLHVVVTGPDLEADVAVTAAAEGKGHIAGVDAEATVTLTCTWRDFMRLVCGRIDPADPGLTQRIALEGDPVLGAALLPALAIAP